MDTDILTDIILAEDAEESEIPTDDGESKRSTRSKDSRGTKIRRAAGQMASYEARRNRDILYQKMVHHRDLYYKYRDLIKKKYRAKNIKRARG
jgi:hypothetical protein